jgi:hypothetical protein
MPHDQGALMAWDKKEEARGPHGSSDNRNSRLREQRRSPETRKEKKEEEKIAMGAEDREEKQKTSTAP